MKIRAIYLILLLTPIILGDRVREGLTLEGSKLLYKTTKIPDPKVYPKLIKDSEDLYYSSPEFLYSVGKPKSFISQLTFLGIKSNHRYILYKGDVKLDFTKTFKLKNHEILIGHSADNILIFDKNVGFSKPFTYWVRLDIKSIHLIEDNIPLTIAVILRNDQIIIHQIFEDEKNRIRVNEVEFFKPHYEIESSLYQYQFTTVDSHGNVAFWKFEKNFRRPKEEKILRLDILDKKSFLLEIDKGINGNLLNLVYVNRNQIILISRQTKNTMGEFKNNDWSFSCGATNPMDGNILLGNEKGEVLLFGANGEHFKYFGSMKVCDSKVVSIAFDEKSNNSHNVGVLCEKGDSYLFELKETQFSDKDYY